MPFTGSHPAAVLALLRTGLPDSALVIGSMTPDLPFFLPLRFGSFSVRQDLGGPAHTAWAVVTLDVALGMIVWALWHGLFSRPALAAAPAAMRRRLAGRVEVGLSVRLRKRQEVARAAVGTAVGAATHVLWDDFTHDGRWGMRILAPLRDDWSGVPGYQWAQYGSSLFGAVVLGIWVVAWWRRVRPLDEGDTDTAFRRCWPARTAWAAIGLAGTTAGVLGGWRKDDPPEAIFRFVTHAGAAALLMATVLALGWHVRHHERSIPWSNGIPKL